MSLVARFWRWLTHRRSQQSTGGTLIRVTTPADGDFVNRMYSYWSSAWVSGGFAFVFVGHVDGKPRFFRLELATRTVTPLGALLPYAGTAEGWYWDANGWIYLCDGPLLRRVNPFSQVDHVVFDISATSPGCRLWQAHSSDDGTVHSATLQRIVESGPYQNIGTVIYREGIGLGYFAAEGTLDESALTGNGRNVIIKQVIDGALMNRIIDLDTGNEQRIEGAAGPIGHSDCGPDYVVGEDSEHGACVRLDLPSLERRTLIQTWNVGHVSVRAGKCLRSDETHLSLVGLEFGGEMAVVEHGMVGNDYDHQVFGNLDPSGQVACFMSNMGGDRFDAYLYVL